MKATKFQCTKVMSILLPVLALACFALLPMAQAVLPPPAPDGGYPGGNTAEGSAALFNLTNGTFNTAIGGAALFHNTTGYQNTATGGSALLDNTTGNYNTANGAFALYSNIDGYSNTAMGRSALQGNISGYDNTATGLNALFSNTTGYQNAADGSGALFSNTTGYHNTAVGYHALLHNIDGSGNTAVGYQALYTVQHIGDNTAVGWEALYNDTSGLGDSGWANTAVGVSALYSNTIGEGNIALGYSAGSNLTTGFSNIDIGNRGVAGEGFTIRIGSNQTKTFIAGIRGITTANRNAVPVMIDSAGQLGTVSSSERFKRKIKPMDKVSEAILALKPVTFHYKSDAMNTPQFGLIAEEVEKVNPDLVVRDENGEIYTVRYEAVNAMLLNEFLKEHHKVEQLEATLAAFNERLKEQDAKIDKVKVKVELTRPAPQVANNGQ